jgi:hypothetical protein
MSIYETSLGKMKVSERGTTRLVVHHGATIATLSTRGADGSVLVSPGYGPAFRAPSMDAACRTLADRETNNRLAERGAAD